ncbi:MAG: arylsulfatase [Verrucomicrobiota bacterium]|jgi:arylsulfatase A-like enzyme
MGCCVFFKHVRLGLAALVAAGWLNPLTLPGASRPNILYILADDLGYGDMHCFNPERGKIPTPNLDRLAGQGMRFTDAHSGSAVCTPTRYGILTGRYAWRSRLQSGVLEGFSPPLIDKERLTVPGLLKQQGYETACIGKWHLGLTFATTGGKTNDLSQPIQDGPTTRGFDYFFGISASLDMPPFAFIENDRFTETPSVEKKWLRKGAAAPGFEAVDVLPTLTRKAVDYLGRRSAEKKPFFLYLALASPHTPIVPTKDWEGKSGLNAYGDFVMQTDWSVGQVVQALETNGLAENTLVIFTSDNGCSPAANVQELERKGHYPSYVFRGYKADIWDGGHHIPFLARWPGRIQPGSVSDQLTCLTDLMATCADLLGIKLPGDGGEDSVSILPALLGRATGPLREAVVHHSINGSFALRQGNWKLVLCPDSGGWSAPKPGSAEAKKLPSIQLYDMTADQGERANTQRDHPDVAARLTRLLENYVAQGRSTDGRPLSNDAPVTIWKSKAPAKDAGGKVITHD